MRTLALTRCLSAWVPSCSPPGPLSEVDSCIHFRAATRCNNTLEGLWDFMGKSLNPKPYTVGSRVEGNLYTFHVLDSETSVLSGLKQISG